MWVISWQIFPNPAKNPAGPPLPARPFRYMGLGAYITRDKHPPQAVLPLAYIPQDLVSAICLVHKPCARGALPTMHSCVLTTVARGQAPVRRILSSRVNPHVCRAEPVSCFAWRVDSHAGLVVRCPGVTSLDFCKSRQVRGPECSFHRSSVCIRFMPSFQHDQRSSQLSHTPHAPHGASASPSR